MKRNCRLYYRVETPAMLSVDFSSSIHMQFLAILQFSGESSLLERCFLKQRLKGVVEMHLGIYQLKNPSG
ncbi:hypothetical protein Y1Q_0021641 [Alligator mississippiensis]|uniref:Uncharacterized protein n=1 Tax=Alligator mississippiensis TaxID=8496 RepID=A0A151PAD8_ALLMI|nr:hypothetical protein Y1Q_0021641 [Alligator mississippiensis]